MNQKFLESMEIIDTVVQTIRRSMDDFKRLDLAIGTPAAGDVMFITHVRICIVLDELADVNRLVNEVPRLRDVFTCVAPFYRYARQYEKGFRKVRNSIVAHYNRDRSGNYTSFAETLGTYDVPSPSVNLSLFVRALSASESL